MSGALAGQDVFDAREENCANASTGELTRIKKLPLLVHSFIRVSPVACMGDCRVIEVRCNPPDLCSLWKNTVVRERRRYMKFVDLATPELAPSNHLDGIVIINWVRNETVRVYPIC